MPPLMVHLGGLSSDGAVVHDESWYSGNVSGGDAAEKGRAHPHKSKGGPNKATQRGQVARGTLASNCARDCVCYEFVGCDHMRGPRRTEPSFLDLNKAKQRGRLECAG